MPPAAARRAGVIRWIIRILMLPVLGIGLLLAVVYPWAANDPPSYEIQRLLIGDASGGFRPAATILPRREEQVRVDVEVVVESGVEPPPGTFATLTVEVAGRRQIEADLTLDGVEPRRLRRQAGQRAYLLEAGTLAPVKEGTYTFVARPGPADFPIVSVDLILVGGTFPYDETMPPLGFGITAFAVITLALTFRRRRENPSPKPSPPKWGRQ